MAQRPWGIALNSTERRTQCHLHLHIGKLLPDPPEENFIVVDDGRSKSPSPKTATASGSIRPGAHLHVHPGVAAGELNLEK